jgi:hypothetical protein
MIAASGLVVCVQWLHHTAVADFQQQRSPVI